jgi:rod shape-determining protein MreC
MVRLNIKKYLSVVAIIILLILLHYSKLLNPLESFLSSGLRPVFKVFYFWGFAINQTYLKSTEKVDLAVELKNARDTISRLMAGEARRKFLEEENLTLRKQLNFLAKSEQHYLAANVVSRSEPESGAENSGSIIIDRGLKDGLTVGLAVVNVAGSAISSQGIIIGKVIKVKDGLAEVCLITDKNCQLAAAILGEKKTSGIVSGELGLTIKMEFIPQTEDIKAGDLVATSGLERNIPSGLVIGRVAKVIKGNNQVWQSAVIEPQTDLAALSVVLILLP